MSWDKTYREHIYKVCTKVDLNDKEDVTEALQYLADEATKNNDFLTCYDNKLQELMSASDYRTWSTNVARDMFKAQIDRMDEGEFKDFCKKRFEEITEHET